MINYNPETVSTDYDECDRLYFEDRGPKPNPNPNDLTLTLTLTNPNGSSPALGNRF